MSSMLEQAIIDAQALKEAALKNAETLVLEKYSTQIKDAVESLLEQENPLAALAPPPEGAPPEDLPAAPADPMTAAAPMADPAAPAMETPTVMEHIPLAATSKDNEQVEIPLDKLMEELAILNETFRFGGDSHNDPELFEHNLAELDVQELQEILSEEEEPPGPDDDDEREGTLKDLGATPGTHTGSEGPQAEGLELSLEEQILAKLEERLEVDLPGPQTAAYAGTPRALIDLAEEELLALEQDSEIREKNAAIRKAVGKLDKVNESLVNKNKKLHVSLEEAASYVAKLRDAVTVLDTKLNESSLANAKLLYQNKALNSNSMNERQKQKLVEAISSADNIEEARVIFETLENTVGSTSRKKQPKSLGEAVQKSSSMILSSSRERSARQKNNPTLDRWKFLAGIDKK